MPSSEVDSRLAHVHACEKILATQAISRIKSSPKEGFCGSGTNGPAGKGQVPGISGRVVSLLPGIALCGLITLVSIGVQHVEERYFDHPYVEALVIAILLGMAVRTAWQPSARWLSGIAFSAKQLLEVAVMLLGASVSFAAVMASGLTLIAAIVATVAIMLAVSYGLSRMLGLSTKLSILIACGNSICGNSAIAAVAPVIGADGDDIASSISFTAILGVLMVLGLPLLIPLLDLSATSTASSPGSPSTPCRRCWRRPCRPASSAPRSARW